MSTIPNRRQRRAALKFQGILKKKKELSVTEWMAFNTESIAKGKEIFNANADAVDKRIAEILEDRELKAIETWKELGYNQPEIDLLREAFAISAVKNKETRKEDKKKVKEIYKTVNSSRLERQNG